MFKFESRLQESWVYGFARPVTASHFLGNLLQVMGHTFIAFRKKSH